MDLDNSKMVVEISVPLPSFFPPLQWKQIETLKRSWISLIEKYMRQKICSLNDLSGFVHSQLPAPNSCMKTIPWQDMFQKKEFVALLNMEPLLLDSSVWQNACKSLSEKIISIEKAHGNSSRFFNGLTAGSFLAREAE